MNHLRRTCLLLLLACLGPAAAGDEAADVAAIEGELSALEEAHPALAPDRLNVYVTLHPGDDIRLDSVRLLLDGTLLAHHLYTEREVAALRREAVHRLYRGDMAPGLHELTVEFTALDDNGLPLAQRRTVRVGAQPEHTRVGIVIGTRDGRPGLEVREW